MLYFLILASFKEKRINSCGHTTDVYLGKSNLLRVNSSKISRGKFISGFVYLGENSGKVTLLISAPKVFPPVEFFGAYI